jgi:hypothetical protein
MNRASALRPGRSTTITQVIESFGARDSRIAAVAIEIDSPVVVLREQ